MFLSLTTPPVSIKLDGYVHLILPRFHHALVLRCPLFTFWPASGLASMNVLVVARRLDDYNTKSLSRDEDQLHCHSMLS
jgi:hypothetical protein